MRNAKITQQRAQRGRDRYCQFTSRVTCELPFENVPGGLRGSALDCGFGHGWLLSLWRSRSEHLTAFGARPTFPAGALVFETYQLSSDI
jgi:hypothetical protein